LIIEHFAEITGFPFLIGTVRTLVTVREPAVFLMFPFLIGTVRTEYQCRSDRSQLEFPFLIGTVRTNKLPYGRLEGTLVSIPHRYGKNPPPHM